MRRGSSSGDSPKSKRLQSLILASLPVLILGSILCDRTNLDELWYGRSGGTQYYVEAVWLGDRRIVFTTDSGVMYAGTLSP